MEKQPQRIGDVFLVDLSACKVADQKLLFDNNDIDDKEVTKPTNINEDIGIRVCSQSKALIVHMAMEIVVDYTRLHAKYVRQAYDATFYALFNAVGKDPFSNAIIVKQEVGWFLLKEEKRKKKFAKMLSCNPCQCHP
jgi:hypothetical protein